MGTVRHIKGIEKDKFVWSREFIQLSEDQILGGQEFGDKEL